MGLGGERGKLTRRQLPHIRAGPHRFGRGISRERRVRIGVHSLRKCLAGINQTNHKHWCQTFYHDVAIKPDCNGGTNNEAIY